MSTVLNAKYFLDLARERWGSDSAVVKNTGVSRTTIWRIENGRIHFRPTTLSKFVKALNK